MKEHLLQNELFYYDHISHSEQDAADIMGFTVKHDTGEGLVAYLQQFSLHDEENGLMRTYLVRSRKTEELVGYFSLKAGLVSTNEHRLFARSFDTIPGVELANFAVNHSFVKKYGLRNVGNVIFGDFVLRIVNLTAEWVGTGVIYLFALPFDKLIATYSDYGFQRLERKQEKRLHRRLKPNYDRSCIFMFRRLDI